MSRTKSTKGIGIEGEDKEKGQSTTSMAIDLKACGGTGRETAKEYRSDFLKRYKS